MINSSIILMSNSAKDYIIGAIERIVKDPGILPALCMTSGFKVSDATNGDNFEYKGKLFVICGYKEQNEGFHCRKIAGKDVWVHDLTLKELQGRVLDLVNLVNCENGNETQVLKAISAM